MRQKLLAAVGSVLLLLLVAVVIVLRRARTEHPPVSQTIPRVDAPSSAADDAGAGSL
ncbi:hypothetical protein [Gordonia liuliyuniae]|uniref:Uncharacterized protein n=1 Tax=Gordonia liuliyuniae TaxID=2911517 RepID=A0ABS9IUA5_9ACTN|nr:hypothetical protein [Gordonia liuliyuniae]MCF8589106.1 hypothetical protein [Gordonia liuliyuniae]